MNIIKQDGKNFVLRFDRGENAIAGVGDFMAAQNVGACMFTGIGSSDEIELGYYNGHLKEYRKKPFAENLEIISLIGNGALLDGKPALHTHGMFGRTDFTVIGGHVFSVKVLATCEIHLTQLEGPMERKNNPEFNLNLLV